VHLWADDIHVSIRLEERRLYLPVTIGVHADDRKEPVAPADDYRESRSPGLMHRRRGAQTG